MNIRHALIAMFLLLAPPVAGAQVTSERIVKAADEPQNWLTYSGGYSSQRYSTLKQIDTANVKNLEIKWILPNQVFGAWQSSPLVVDGIMYLTMRPNDVLAVDAKSGRVFWQYHYHNSPDQRVCCGSNNRGVAMLGDTLFMGTLDAHLVAIDAKTGTAALERRGRRPEARLLDHARAAHRQGQGDRRRRRRRVRHPRLHHRARSEDRQGNVAFQHHSRAGREGDRDLARRGLEARRRLGVGDRLLRSRAQSDVLGDRGIRVPTGHPASGPVTTCSPTRCSRSIPTPAPSSGTTSSRRTTATTTTRCRCRCSPTSTWKGTPTKAMLWANRNGFFYVLDRDEREVPLGDAVREGELGERP